MKKVFSILTVASIIMMGHAAQAKERTPAQVQSKTMSILVKDFDLSIPKKHAMTVVVNKQIKKIDANYNNVSQLNVSSISVDEEGVVKSIDVTFSPYSRKDKETYSCEGTIVVGSGTEPYSLIDSGCEL